MTQPPAASRDYMAFTARGGDMGRRIAAYDWASSPLGPVEDWPAVLRHTLAVILPAQAEIVLFWGAEQVALYNDAYAPTIGNKHPHALGRPACETWTELWDDLEPLLTHVRTTGETYAAKDRPFYIERAGYGEQVYFDISYSPVALDDGSVGGVLCIVSETTGRVRAAREVSEDRARLHQMFDQAPGFVAVLREPGHVFELANAAFRALVDGREMIGRTVADALPEVVSQGLVARLDEVRATGVPFRGEGVPVTVMRADGTAEERRLDFVYQPVTDAGGEVTAIFVQGIDLTEQHRALGALALSRDSLELATRMGEIGTWEYDLRTGTFTGSERNWAMHGYPPGTVATTAQFLAAIHADDRAAMSASFAAAIDPAVRALHDVEYRIFQPDGTMRWVAVTGRGVFEDDVCTRAIGTITDVTQRRTEADALRESEQRFRALADEMEALVWITDETGRFVFANAGFQKILGVTPEAMRRDGWAPLLRDEDRALLAERMPLFYRDPRPLRGDYRLKTADGGTIWAHGVSRPRYSGDRFLGYVGCAVDVTERHLAGEALEERVAERTAELTRQIAERERVEETLHQMQRLEAVGQLTSGVAHDFNNLLTVVLGNIEMIAHAAAAGPLDARALQRLEHVRIAAERGATLTAQLLAFSRRQRLEAKTVDLNDTVRALAPLMASTLGRSIAIEQELADGVWPALVDPTQIELILLNLAINARDAMVGGGRLTLSTANVSLDVPQRPEEPVAGDYIRVAVTDTGTGMTDEVLARAFEPFFTTKEVGKGSGLGLAQVFGFAKQSGGGVRIDTVAGEGTTVSVYLPRARDVAAAAAVAAIPAASAAPIAGRCILVVDDEDNVRQVTADTLRAAGCRVVEAVDGDTGLRALAHTRGIEAVVADVAMPGMNGVEFARRARRRHPDLPVLFVTGYADLAAIAEVPEEQIIRKPYTRDALLSRVRQMLDRPAAVEEEERPARAG
ncbi:MULTISPECIES: hybrid sensor histidine kinase/response regulator [Sphingomonas]|uniref:hybrid sensor histidine kinase/response regulator n=1 Tax=Sphingomonas TaxID=13687 RepID=UPI000AC3324F|nr:MULTISPECIES: PAS domain S-box protein [Sphingomonas]MBY0301489.1 PAS domain S-box protein [Sphingomonas ginsenosidimutans]